MTEEIITRAQWEEARHDPKVLALHKEADRYFAEQDPCRGAAMDKMRAGLRRADGKIMKPPGFVPPDMTAALLPIRGRS